MAAGATYTSISSTTLSSNAATITLSSIPSTYTDLICVFNGSNTIGNDNYLMYFNGVVTGSLYSATYVESDGASAYSGSWNNRNNIPVARGGSSTAGADLVIIQLNGYANTSIYKSTISRYALGGTLGARTSITNGLYRSTTAINSITLTGSGNIVAGSTITLYGIASA